MSQHLQIICSRLNNHYLAYVSGNYITILINGSSEVVKPLKHFETIQWLLLDEDGSEYYLFDSPKAALEAGGYKIIKYL